MACGCKKNKLPKTNNEVTVKQITKVVKTNEIKTKG